MMRRLRIVLCLAVLLLYGAASAQATVSLVGSPITKSLGANGGSTTAANTSGADLFVMVVAYDPGVVIAAGDISETGGPSNTWHAKTVQAATGNKNQIFYAWNATGAASHVFTITKTSSFCAVIVYAFAGSKTSSDPFDAENGSFSNAGPSSIQPGSASLSAAGVYVTGLSDYTASGAAAIDSSFSTPDFVAFVGAQSYAVDASYKITAAGSEIPTWSSLGGLAFIATTITAFEGSTGGGGCTTPPSSLTLVGVGACK